MIGRAAHGRPWIFREIAHFLATGERLPTADAREIESVLLEQLDGLYELYGELQGTRVARKHIGWTLRGFAGAEAFRQHVNRIDSAAEQRAAVRQFFARHAACAWHETERLAA
jgi:tRNA-dihydrouridine synthase B